VIASPTVNFVVVVIVRIVTIVYLGKRSGRRLFLNALKETRKHSVRRLARLSRVLQRQLEDVIPKVAIAKDLVA